MAQGGGGVEGWRGGRGVVIDSGEGDNCGGEGGGLGGGRGSVGNDVIRCNT